MRGRTESGQSNLSPEKKLSLAGDVWKAGKVNRQRDYYSVQSPPHTPFSQKRQKMDMGWYTELRFFLMKSQGNEVLNPRMSVMESQGFGN
jgi:hypothetical protein